MAFIMISKTMSYVNDIGISRYINDIGIMIRIAGKLREEMLLYLVKLR